MRGITGLLIGFTAACCAGGLLLAPAAQASAATLWVSSATAVIGDGTSCTAPGFNTIQGAVDAAPAGASINVCQGTYSEQLQITKSVTIDGLGNAIVALPTAVVNATTACDTAPGTGSRQPDQDGISICGNVTVTMNHMVVDAAWPASTCYDSLYGLLVAGGATLRFAHSSVIAAGAFPLNGCQGGIGIQVGMGWTTPVQVGHLVASDSWISGYQKNGITVEGWRSTAAIDHTTVAGVGPTPAIAQNGIEVADTAKVSITSTTIVGNECDVSVCGSDNLTQTQSAGVLFIGPAFGSTISDSVLSDNDMGLYYTADPAGRAIVRPQVVISTDTFTDNRYEGIALDQGAANVTHCTITHGNIGIQILQYGGTSGGQTFGSNSVASFDEMTHLSVATVDVLSDRAAQGDKRGTFSIRRSEIDTAPVLDNSRNLPIIKKSDF